ncbi:unnamed protein product [Parajaminaea phylloscopi]
MRPIQTGGAHSSVHATRPPFLAYPDRASASTSTQDSRRGSLRTSYSLDSTGSCSSSSSSSNSYHSTVAIGSPPSPSAASDFSAPSSVDGASTTRDRPVATSAAAAAAAPKPRVTGRRESTAKEDGLYQLVYTSSSRNRYLTPDVLQSILVKSRSRNASNDITGLLLYRDGSFAQFLEGPRDAVCATFHRIEADERHRGVIVVLQREIERRDFDSWRMAFRDLDFTMPEENMDETTGQVGKRGATLADADDLDDAKSCLVDLTLAEEKDLTHEDTSASVRTLVRVFHSSLARSI